MKVFFSLSMALFMLAACGQQPTPKVEDVASNRIDNDEVTEVPDETMPSNAVDIERDSAGNAVDPD